VLRNLPCRRIQADEVWSFSYAKQKTVPTDKLGAFGYGDVWTWTALCADTKLIPSWIVGRRDAGAWRANAPVLERGMLASTPVREDNELGWVMTGNSHLDSRQGPARLVDRRVH
jgi:hypothetical protein